MGVLVVETGGSFGQTKAQFKAVTYGHAHAVRRAIQFLSEEVLKDAINLDHKLHDEGDAPDKGFREE